MPDWSLKTKAAAVIALFAVYFPSRSTYGTATFRNKLQPELSLI